MKLRGFIAALALTGLAACAATTKFDAAGDIHTFLAAVRDGDRATFDAHVDRDAIKSGLQARLIAEAAKSDGAKKASVASMLLASPLLSGVAIDALVRPEVFKAAAQYLGYAADRPLPDRLTIASGLRYVERDRVCVARKKTDPCLFIFRNESGVWKLVGYEGDLKL